jgi:hypothetical protein
MRKHLSTLALSISFLLSGHSTQSIAQNNPTFMQLGRAKRKNFFDYAAKWINERF